MKPSSRLLSAALVLGASLCVFAPNAALAHAHLISSVPADKDMAMPAPGELTLTFSEGLELKLSKVVVTGPDKTRVTTGTLRLDPSDNKVMFVPLPSALPDGVYTVEWQVVAKDGHKTTGTFSFDAMK